MLYEKLKNSPRKIRSLLRISDQINQSTNLLVEEIRGQIIALHHRLNAIETRQSLIDRRLEFIQESLGRSETRQLKQSFEPNLHHNEFRVFSQWGEDGIIQYLLRHIEIETKTFIEFGADFYHIESNTRFLLTNENWQGLVIDGSQENIDRLKDHSNFWLYNLKGVQAFITRDNINGILRENGFVGEVGLLSIDIDGNDYWVWRAINVISPVIVIVEYNHRFGSELAVTTPYDENFDRARFHPSKLLYGASLRALCQLANQKGYSFVGCNRNGVNAFFVRKDRKPESIRDVTPEEGYVPGQFGEMKFIDGKPDRSSPAEERQVVTDLLSLLVEVDE